MTPQQLKRRVGAAPRRKVKRPRTWFERRYRAAATRNYANMRQEYNKHKSLWSDETWLVKWMTVEGLKKAFPEREPLEINMIRPHVTFIDELQYPKTVTQISKLRQLGHTETHIEMLKRQIDGGDV